MITGAHSVIYSADAAADRVFLRDVLKLRGVDAGEGWLIFALPPSEIAVHPAEKNGASELYFMCADIEAFIAEMRRHDIVCGPVQQQTWGLLTYLTLPGGGTVGVYEPRHARPSMRAGATRGGRPARKTTKKNTRPPGQKQQGNKYSRHR